MTSRTFCCNGSLLKKQLSRYRLLSLGLLALLLTNTYNALDILFLTEVHESLLYEWSFFTEVTGITEFLFSLLAAPCVFSYLHKKRSNHFFHSLPLSQDSLFLSSFVSGLLLYALPWLLPLVLTTPILALGHIHCSVLWLGYMEVMVCRLLLYFISFSIFSLAMVLCGRSFFAVIFGCLLHFVFPLLEELLQSTLSPYLFGIGTETAGIAGYLSPLLLLRFSEWWLTGIYTAAALLLAYLTLRLHRKRKEEEVGQSIVFPALLAVLQYFFTFLGSYFLYAFIRLLSGRLDSGSFSVYYILLYSVPAFFLVKMILHRSARVFQKKTFLHCGIYVLSFFLVITAFRIDLFGIVRKVPKAEDVTMVEVSLNNMAYDSQDPEAIREVIVLHSAIIERQEALRKIPTYDETFVPVDTCSLKLTYITEKGKVLHRSYLLPTEHLKAEHLEVWTDVEAFLQKGQRPIEHLHKLREEIFRVDFFKSRFGSITLSTAQQAELFLALEQDMKDFGLRSLVLVHGKNSIGDLTLLLKNGRSADLYLPPEAKNARALINEISARTGVTD